MISFKEAQQIINDNIIILGIENVDIKTSLGRVLAHDVESDINMPPFDKSAMDGYAIRRKDLFNELEVIETIKAGEIPRKKINAGQCSKIMTGALIPEGADTVIMVELTEATGLNKIKFTGTDSRPNISYKAEDIKLGEVVLKKGTLLRPQEIAILASVGCTYPVVYKLPRIAIMSTGDEIVEPHLVPDSGKIRNSNAYQLIGQVQKCGISPDYLGIIEDTEEATYNKISGALQNYDILLLTGGISMGDFDFVPKVMEKAGVTLLIQTIAMKPGKPTVFGRKDNTFVFCLPGNPVSSFAVFELFAESFIKAMSGYKADRKLLKLKLKETFTLKASDRLTWIPVEIDENEDVIPVSFHGSAHIYALCFAQGLMPIEAGISQINKGEIVHVRPF